MRDDESIQQIMTPVDETDAARFLLGVVLMLAGRANLPIWRPRGSKEPESSISRPKHTQ